MAPKLKLIKVLNFSDLTKLVRMKECVRQRFVSVAVYITCNLLPSNLNESLGL